MIERTMGLELHSLWLPLGPILEGYFMRFSLLEKAGGAILVTVWLLYGTIAVGNLLLPVEEPAVATTMAKAPSKQAAKTDVAPATQDLTMLLAAASPESGAKAFKKCKACHTTHSGGAHKVGPNLWEVVGRSKAGAQGFAYSSALDKFGGTWGYEDLDAYLTKPKEYVPGTKMSFAGLKKAPERAAVIAYLRSLSESPKPLP